MFRFIYPSHVDGIDTHTQIYCHSNRGSDQSIKHKAKIFTLAIAMLAISACQNYSLSINENEIYTPPTLFTDYEINDPALSLCIEKTILEEKITTATELKTLICSEKGILSLNGIEQFPAIKVLGISNNSLMDIAALALINQLEKIDLSNNYITSTEPLLHFQNLISIDLRGNNTLTCIELSANNKPLMPMHCQ